MKKLLLACALVLALSPSAYAQMGIGASLPSGCTPGGEFYLTSGTIGLYICTATNTWTITWPALLSVPLPSSQGGTGTAFFTVAGPASSAKTFTFPNASATVLTDNALVTSAQGGTGNGFTKFSGPATPEKTFTLPNASATVLTDNATVTVAQGGTSLATLTAHALYVGNGTSAPTAIAVCGTGTYLRGVATADPVCSTLTLPNSATAGDTIIATGANALGAVTAVATGSYFRSAGTSTAPVWSTLILPNAATQGDLMVATSANTIGSLAAVATGSLLQSAGTSTAPAYTTATYPATAATGNYLIATGTNAIVAVTPALAHAKPADQTGNATSTFKMNGLGAAAAPCVITPVATGRIVFIITGQLTQSTTADGVTVKLAEGTGSIPANAAAAAGTVISATQTWTALTGQLTTQFSITASTTGFALNTAVWFDLQIADVTGGTATAKNIDCTAFEV